MKAIKLFQPKFDWLWILLALITFLLAISLTACSPQSRLNRIIEKNPELAITNNVTITDTLWLTNTQIDTIFSSSVDSIFISNDSIQIKYIKVKDKVYLSGKTVFKPVIRERIVSVKAPAITKVVMKEHWYLKFLIYWFIFSLIIILIYLTIKLISYNNWLTKLPF